MKNVYAVSICFYLLLTTGVQWVYSQTNTGYVYPRKTTTWAIEDRSLTDSLYKIAREKIDSISRGVSLGQPFCTVYSGSMGHITKQIGKEDSEGSLFIKKFTVSFARYFLEPLDEYESGTLTRSSSWANYFNHPKAQRWQLILTGVNTHINSDMWQALVDNFSGEQIRKNKKLFLSAQRSVGKVYRPFYDSILANSHYLRNIHSLTKGLPFIVGGRILYKWRQRQVRLAILYYHDQKRFYALLARVQRKKLRNDALILRERKQS